MTADETYGGAPRRDGELFFLGVSRQGCFVARTPKKKLTRSKPPGYGQKWTPEEDEKVRMLWGLISISALAKRLGRSVHGVAMRARALHVLPAREAHGLITLGGAQRISGYDRAKLQAVIVLLKLKLRKIPCIDPQQKPVRSQRGMDEVQWQKVYDYLSTQPDRRMVILPTSTRTPREVWGSGGKPMKCIGCDQNNRPHYAFGRCAKCYLRHYRQRRKVSDA